MSPKAPRSPWRVVSASERESAILRKSGEILEYLRQQSKNRDQRVRLRDLLSRYVRLLDADLDVGKNKLAKDIKNTEAEAETALAPAALNRYGNQRPKPHLGPSGDLSLGSQTTDDQSNQESSTELPGQGGVSQPAPPDEIVLPEGATDESLAKAESDQTTELVESCRARVAAIKHSINERVGNSMALLSNTNDSGKVYLNALLIVMKALGNAPREAIEVAMENLEAAYQAVLPTLGPAVEGVPDLNTASVSDQSMSAAGNLGSETKVGQPKDGKDCVGLDDHKVSTGLGQLLAEWKLFKAGGLLGNGASGQDHPLYQTLKDLPMTVVVTGRFEGVTPEVRQNISDHMKGWYYEQEIKYIPDETFTDYLRRVVCKIINNQSESDENDNSHQGSA